MHNKRTVHTILLIRIFIVTLFIMIIACDDEVYYRHRDSDEVGWIGVRITKFTRELREELDADTRRGVVITEVIEDSPADQAGLKRNDIIVRFDRKRIRGEKDLIRKVRSCVPGEKVKVQFERAGELKTITLKVGELPGRYARRHRDGDWDFDLDFPSGGDFLVRVVKPDEFQGARLQELNSNLAEYFEVDPKDGVLIIEVEPDTPADEAGLRAGDIITRMDENKVSSIVEVDNVLDDFDDGEKIKIEYIRHGEKATTELQVEKWRKKKTRPGRYFRFHPPAFRFKFDGDELREDITIFREELEETIRDEVLENLRNNLDELDHIEIDIDTEDFKRDMEQLKEDLKRLKVELKDTEFSI